MSDTNSQTFRVVKVMPLPRGFKFPERFNIFTDRQFSRYICRMVESGFDVNSTNPDGETILLWILKHFADETLPGLVVYLLDKGANVHKKHPKTEANALELLLDNLDSWRELNMPALVITAMFLINKGLYVRKWKGIDRTARGPWSYIDEILEVFDFILESGVDVNCTNKNGMNLLMKLASNYFRWDAIQGKIELACMLVDRGINVHKTANFLGYSSLNAFNFLCLSSNGKICQRKDFHDLVKLFLSKGMDINNVYGIGNSPVRRNSLIQLCISAKPLDEVAAEAIASLIKYGINIHYTESDEGHNALTALCDGGGVPRLKGVLHLARILVNDYKIAVKPPGKNALMALVTSYFGRFIYFLGRGEFKRCENQILEKSQDNERDFYSLTELLLANMNECSVDDKRQFGIALMHICISYWGNNILDVIKLLCDYGANVNTQYLVRDRKNKARKYHAIGMIAKNEEQKHRASHVYSLLSNYGFRHKLLGKYRDLVVESLSLANRANVCVDVDRKQLGR